MLANATTGAHAVQFYEAERFMHRAAANFLGPALGTGEPIVLIVRRRTFDGITRHLSRDIAAGDAVSRILFVDADATLPTVMDGQTLDTGRLQPSPSPTSSPRDAAGASTAPCGSTARWST